MKCRMQYSSDLTDRQWQLIRQSLPPRSRRDRRPIDRRRIINAILYMVRTGCQWRLLPKNWGMVLSWIGAWSALGNPNTECSATIGRLAMLCDHLRGRLRFVAMDSVGALRDRRLMSVITS